jgi:uncharacterized repeat protein (TIGR01451 family)
VPKSVAATVNCPVGTIATGSGYATSGTGTYFGRNAIYWLDWSCGTTKTFVPGDTVTKTWTAPNGIGIKAILSNITKTLGPYSTGAYGGDRLNKLYGGVNPIGLSNVINGEDPTYKVSFSMTLNGVAIPADIATAEAESTDGPNESATWTTDGDAWQLLERNGTALKTTFSNGGKTLYMDDNPDSGFATLVALTENVSNINVTMFAGGKEAIAFGIFVPFDYGDAPSTYGSAPHYARRHASGSSQPTTATGISSLTMGTLSYSTPYLGAIGADPEGVPLPAVADAPATGDNTSGDNDEDAFTSLPKIGKNTTYSLNNIPVNNTSGIDATLSAWIDFNKNGVFEASEFVSTTVINGATSQNLSWTMPAGTTGGSTYARFRITTSTLVDLAGTATVDERATDTANNGEVEDYQVTIVNPADVLLLKRITAINGLSTNPNDNTFSLTGVLVDSKWKTGYVVGAVNGGPVKPGDTIEYTIYYLNNGDRNAKSARICERLNAKQTFQPDTYTTGAGMQVQIGGDRTNNTALTLTNQSGDDGGQFVAATSPVTALPTNCNSVTGAPNNDYGALILDLVTNPGSPNLTTLPAGTGQGTPNDSFGFWRFTTKVNKVSP